MLRSSLVSVITIVAFLTAAIAAPAAAGPTPARFAATAPAASAPVTSTLRASIDRAAAQPVAPIRGTTPVRKARMQGGGGGGGGMMLMTLIGTAVGLAGTYFLVKEMRKQTDEARNAQ